MQKSTFDKFVENPDNRRILEQERLFVEATELLSAVMETSGVRRAELAGRLGRSKAYVTQILRGTQNLTLRTLADVFNALNYRLVIDAEPIAASECGSIESRQWDVTQQTGNSTVAVEETPADDLYIGAAA